MREQEATRGSLKGAMMRADRVSVGPAPASPAPLSGADGLISKENGYPKEAHSPRRFPVAGGRTEKCAEVP